MDVNRHECRQSSIMLNFQDQRQLTLAINAIRKAPRGHREPTHCSATATHGRVRWPVYTAMHGVTCAGTCLLLLCNVHAQRELLRPLMDARNINPAQVEKNHALPKHSQEFKHFLENTHSNRLLRKNHTLPVQSQDLKNFRDILHSNTILRLWKKLKLKQKYQ